MLHVLCRQTACCTVQNCAPEGYSICCALMPNLPPAPQAELKRVHQETKRLESAAAAAETRAAAAETAAHRARGAAEADAKSLVSFFEG